MKLIIGIGNPGEKYAKTRHNVGFMVVDAMESKYQISNIKYQNGISTRSTSSGLMLSRVEALKFKNNKKLQSLIAIHQSLIFAKPQTFMNSSGIVVRKIIVQYKVILPNMWVIHDDLDLPLGRYKIQKGRGPKDHNGLLSIYEKLGTRDFWHVRVGVDNREKIENRKWKMENYMNGKDYVLMNFNANELKVIKLTIDKVVEDLIERITNN